MSAYVVDPRTIDYLVAWAQRRRCGGSVRVPEGVELSPDIAVYTQEGMTGRAWFKLNDMPADVLGRILMAENVRSVRYRYPDTAPDDMPGPIDQSGVWSYRYRPVSLDSLKPAWVVRSSDCLSYQSCESDDWEDTLAHAVLDAIREDAIDAMIGDDAPWGVTDDNLTRKPVGA